MLDISKKNEIESSTQDLLKGAYSSLDSLTPPINLGPILKQFGLTVKYAVFSDPTISGAYDKEEKIIYVSNDDTYTRKLFTIAHELGHFILHKDKNREIFYRQDMARLGLEDLEDEQQANWFAAALLMPEKLVKKYWDLTKNIDELATIFGTSPAATYFRLKNLHLIE